jgi:hypothetical protein
LELGEPHDEVVDDVSGSRGVYNGVWETTRTTRERRGGEARRRREERKQEGRMQWLRFSEK